jgi:hypothetical protein
VLDRLGDAADPADDAAPEGAQLKVNMLLSRLPRLRTTVSPEAAFAGTFHVNETMTQLDDAYAAAVDGGIRVLPAEIYCHSLTDPSILGPTLQQSGPDADALRAAGSAPTGRRFSTADYRSTLVDAATRSLDAVLAEPPPTACTSRPTARRASKRGRRRTWRDRSA